MERSIAKIARNMYTFVFSNGMMVLTAVARAVLMGKADFPFLIDIRSMSRRAFLNFAMIVFTLASSLGESLHALPGLAHGDESAVCHVRTDHMEAPAEDHHEDCPICQSATPFQTITSEAADSFTIECCRACLPGDSFDFVSDRFESLSARAPPLS